MRWNVVIGGQLFSKSLRGFTTYKMEMAGHEGWPIAVALLLLPFVILTVLVKLFLPQEPRPAAARPVQAGAISVA
jgi:predicted membrane protein